MAFGRARRDAERDSRQGDETCKHPAPWNSAGPLYDDDGKAYNKYWCNECGTTTRIHYYS
jgi:hypothetical protein